MVCPIPLLKKRKETRRNAIIHPQSHPFINVGFRDGMGRVLALPQQCKGLAKNVSIDVVIGPGYYSRVVPT